MKNLKLNITKTDAKNAGEYCNHRSCLAATAAKRQFGGFISCGPYGITIGNIRYGFTKRAEQRIRRSYPNISRPQKVKRDFKPFTVTLMSPL